MAENIYRFLQLFGGSSYELIISPDFETIIVKSALEVWCKCSDIGVVRLSFLDDDDFESIETFPVPN